LVAAVSSFADDLSASLVLGDDLAAMRAVNDRAINTDALVAAVSGFADELDEVLALGADPAAVARVNDLTDRLNDLALALTYAEVAGQIVSCLQERLHRRCSALVEVHSLDWDAVNFVHTYSRGTLLREFGPRFAPSADELTDEDIPF